MIFIKAAPRIAARGRFSAWNVDEVSPALEIASRPTLLRLARALLSVILHNGTMSMGHVSLIQIVHDSFAFLLKKTYLFSWSKIKAVLKLVKLFKFSFIMWKTVCFYRFGEEEFHPELDPGHFGFSSITLL